MNNLNYETKLPSVSFTTKQSDSANSPLRQVTFKATKYNTSYNEPLMKEWNEE